MNITVLILKPGILMSNCLSKTESDDLRMLAFFPIQDHKFKRLMSILTGYGATLIERTFPLGDGETFRKETSIIQDTSGNYYKGCFFTGA